MTSDPTRRGKFHKVTLWLFALLVTMIAFYGLDHFVMSMQGLPLNWDLTPRD